MKALILKKICSIDENNSPLLLSEIPEPKSKPNEIIIKIKVCGICHTEIYEIEGRTSPLFFPIVLGHQAVGVVDSIGSDSNKFKIGDRVGVGWINSACGRCFSCLSENENLCSEFKATGRDVNGGYAELISVNENFAFKIPDKFSDEEAAPLFCAGAIGRRSLNLTKIKNGESIGLVGFGASAHIVLKIIKHLFSSSKIFVFTRSISEQNFAKKLGADWCGSIEESSPEKLNAIIDTTPAWKPIVESLKNLLPNGRLVINAIRKEDADKKSLLNLDYSTHLWMEKEIKTVANVSRKDIEDFLKLAALVPIIPEYEEYCFEDANIALFEIKNKKIRGAKILRISN